MNKKNQTQTEFDPRLVKMIALLRPTPRRNPNVVERNRDKFLTQVDTLIGTGENPSQKKKFYQFQPKEKNNMNTFKPKFALSTLFVIATILVFLFGGTGLTVYAAQAALPGDALYPVKTGVEQTRLSLTSADDQLAQMNLTLAQKRLTEIEGLIREGRFDQVTKTAAEFERHVQQMSEAIKRLAETDPMRASELTSQLMTELSKYMQALTGMLSGLPDEVKVEVQKVIIGSESASGMDDQSSPIEFTGIISALSAQSWTVAGRVVAVTSQTEIKGTFAVGDSVKVHALVAADGSLTAREIEATAAVGNDNLNQNANENENENSNLNENDNANGNENDNANDNANDNDDENENGTSDDDEFEFKGTVQTILPDMWVIGGVTVMVTAETSWQNAISVGDYVEVYAKVLPDGSLQATTIKLEDGSTSGDDNSNDDSSSDDDDSNNDNDDDSDDDRSDDSNDNSDDDSNDNSDDDSDEGSDDNSNGGSDDD